MNYARCFPILVTLTFVYQLMGLAVYNSVILDLRFPPICYRKLLSPAVVPFDNPQTAVGITTVSLEDFKQVMPVRTTLLFIKPQASVYNRQSS